MEQPLQTSRNINAQTDGSLSLESITVNIPPGTLARDATVSITKLTSTQANSLVPAGLQLKLGSDVYEIVTSGERNFGANSLTIKIKFDPKKIAAGQSPVIHYRDEATGQWIDLPTAVEHDPVTGSWYAVVQVNHLTKFAVFSTVVQVPEVIALIIGESLAFIEGKPFFLDAAPIIDEATGRTLVPLRFICEALDATVDYDAATRQIRITLGDKEILLTLDSRTAFINGVAVQPDAAPFTLPPGRTYVPLRFICEALDATLDYDEKTKLIKISK